MPKYKPRNIGKIQLKNFTEQTSIAECIEFYQLAFVPGRQAPPPGPYGHDGSVLDLGSQDTAQIIISWFNWQNPLTAHPGGIRQHHVEITKKTSVTVKTQKS